MKGNNIMIEGLGPIPGGIIQTANVLYTGTVANPAPDEMKVRQELEQAADAAGLSPVWASDTEIDLRRALGRGRDVFLYEVRSKLLDDGQMSRAAVDERMAVFGKSWPFPNGESPRMAEDRILCAERRVVCDAIAGAVVDYAAALEKNGKSNITRTRAALVDALAADGSRDDRTPDEYAEYLVSRPDQGVTSDLRIGLSGIDYGLAVREAVALYAHMSDDEAELHTRDYEARLLGPVNGGAVAVDNDLWPQQGRPGPSKEPGQGTSR